MQTKRFVFLWLVTFSLSVAVRRRHYGVHAAPKPSAVPSARRWNNSVMKKASRAVLAVSNRTEYVTKLQVEDLDEATSAGCLRLRELNFCDDDAGTARYPNAVGHSSESEAKTSLKLFLSFLDNPSCSHSLRPFLCVALTPACSSIGDDDTPAALPPCRTLCSAAVEGCKEVTNTLGVAWPVEWSCDRFPVEGVCLDQPLHHSAGLESGLDDRSLSADWRSQSFSILSRGSLQPPPSSAFDIDLLALPNDTISTRQPATSKLLEDSRFFRGWVDVQGLGKANDYCRVIGTSPRDRILSCAINGTEDDQYSYISKQGFDAGRPRTGFMIDMDGDRRDDYCRCVGNAKSSQLICMKAGKRGFYGGKQQSGSQYTIRVPASSVFANYCRRSRDALNIVHLDKTSHRLRASSD